jgi:type I restriction enzyme S subunit
VSLTLKPYPEYKDSGLPWLNEIPAHWGVWRTKNLFSERVQKGFPNEPLLAATQTHGVIAKADYESRTVVALKDLHLLKLVERGDYVVSLRSFEGGIELAHRREIISPAYTVLTPGPDARQDFFQFFFKSAAFVASLPLFITGIREGQNIDYVRLSRAKLPVPPPDEQVALGRFLRVKTAELSLFIRAKQRLIELLNEQKQVIIHHAVTRGLDPDAPMKPTGLDWLPEVPEHWKIRRLKHIARLRSGDSITGSEINDTGAYPVFGGNGLRGYTSDYTHDGDYVLIGRQGALCGNVNYASGKFWASEHAVVASPVREQDLLWFGELLRAMNLNQYSQSAAQPGLSVERIENLGIPVPDFDEQKRISDWISAEISIVEAAIVRARREIELIREYRTRLISDVVTGKLDVRGVELPDGAGDRPGVNGIPRPIPDTTPEGLSGVPRRSCRP